MKPLNIALIGCGGRGLRHAENLRSSPRLNFLAVCDMDEEKVEKAAQKFDVKPYTDSSELLKQKELEAVVIVTQAKHHAPLSIEALEAGKHVLCEKPIADSLKAGHEMLKAVGKTGLKGVIGYQNRFTPFYHTLKKVSCELEPVQVMLTSQRGIFLEKYLLEGSSYGILDGATHSIDIVNWLIGFAPKSVFGSLRHRTFTNTGAIDTLSIQIEYGDKSDLRVGNIIASMGGPGLNNVCQVVGKKGNAQRGNGGNIKVTDISFSEKAGKEKDRQKSSSRIIECEALSGSDPTMSLQEAFADYIQGEGTENEPGVATFQDGFNALLVAEAAVLSHKRDREINLADIIPCARC